MLREDTKTLPILNLVVDKGGPKLEKAKPGSCWVPAPDNPPPSADARPCGKLFQLATEMTGSSIPIAALADGLSIRMGLLVTDQTGIVGDYDVTLRWEATSGDPAVESSPAGLAPASFDTQNEAIHEALRRQPGLTLSPARGPVRVMFVERVERPSAN